MSSKQVKRYRKAAYKARYKIVKSFIKQLQTENLYQRIRIAWIIIKGKAE